MIRQQNTRDSFDRALMSGVNRFERDFIYKSFNRDVAIAEDVRAVLQVSTLFEPMVPAPRTRSDWDYGSRDRCAEPGGP